MLISFSPFLLFFSSASQLSYISEADYPITCSKTGKGVTIEATKYVSHNDIEDTSWVWTSNGVTRYDFCSISKKLEFLEGSSVGIIADSADELYLYIDSYEYGRLPNNAYTDISSYFFKKNGFYNVTIESRHAYWAYGFSYRLEENYTCVNSCNDCKPLTRKCACKEDEFFLKNFSCIHVDKKYEVDVSVDGEKDDGLVIEIYPVTGNKTTEVVVNYKPKKVEGYSVGERKREGSEENYEAEYWIGFCVCWILLMLGFYRAYIEISKRNKKKRMEIEENLLGEIRY